MRILKNFTSKVDISIELIQFLWQHKLWWLIPLVILLLVLGLLLILAQATGIVPLIYPVF
jgi:hypothetical protein